MKKLLSILLSLVLLSSLCAAFAEEDVIDVSIVVVNLVSLRMQVPGQNHTHFRLIYNVLETPTH